MIDSLLHDFQMFWDPPYFLFSFQENSASALVAEISWLIARIGRQKQAKPEKKKSNFVGGQQAIQIRPPLPVLQVWIQAHP